MYEQCLYLDLQNNCITVDRKLYTMSAFDTVLQANLIILGVDKKLLSP